MPEQSKVRVLAILGIVLMLTPIVVGPVSGLFLSSRSNAQTQSEATGVVIPLYNYPDSTWKTIIQDRGTYPNVPIIAVINPNSGPGSAEDPSFLQGIQNLQSAGVTVLGYVDTLSTSLSSAESQVMQYLNWYGVNGIFFDDMYNTAGEGNSYYSSLNSYTKSLGMTYTMGNPGTSVSSSSIGIFNNLVIYESSGYPSLSFISYPGYPNSDFSLIAYGVSYSSTFVLDSAPYVGYVYIDNYGGSNPYYTLSSLYTQTVATLSTIDSLTSTSSTSSSSTTTTTTSSSTKTTTTSSNSISSSLTISSETTSGNAISGFWTELYNAAGTAVATGYTPTTYALTNGLSYTVEADGYGSCSFAYWQDTGNSSYLRTISIDADTNLVAVYNCGTSSSTSTISTTSSTTSTSTASTTTTTTTVTSSSSTSQSPVTIKVRSANLAGSVFTGMWTTVQGVGGQTLASGYTTFTFNGVSGNTYMICVSNYGQTIFSHWGDGSTNSCETVTPASDIVLTAYYNTQITIKVKSADLSGSAFSGMWTTIISNGNIIATGYTPFVFHGESGTTYTICVSNYKQTTFSHWGDGSTNSCETVTPASDIVQTAYYNT